MINKIVCPLLMTPDPPINSHLSCKPGPRSHMSEKEHIIETLLIIDLHANVAARTRFSRNHKETKKNRHKKSFFFRQFPLAQDVFRPNSDYYYDIFTRLKLSFYSLLNLDMKYAIILSIRGKSMSFMNY